MPGMDDDDAWTYSTPASRELLVEPEARPGEERRLLQPGFAPKATPADPHTTRHDANLVRSKDSSNGLAKQPELPQFRSLIAIWQELTEEESPKIIAYRKGRHQKTLSAEYGPQYLREQHYDPRLYVDEKFGRTRYRYAVMKRNVEFHQTFRSLDLTDRFLDDFACALSREILLQGRLYVTERHVCFNSNLLGWVTLLVVPFADIKRIDKKSTAGFFPNGIAIETAELKHNFASFILRDSTYEFLRAVWLELTGRDVAELDATPPMALPKALAEQRALLFLMALDGDNSLLELEPGPAAHAPTAVPESALDDEETEVCAADVAAPLGAVYGVLFGPDTAFQRRFLESHKGSDIAGLAPFRQRTRLYTYRRELGYAIGPKLTRCLVTETVEHADLSHYAVVNSVTTTPDVPLGGLFAVHTRYYLLWAADNGTRLRIAYCVKWSGLLWIKKAVESLTRLAQEAVAADLVLLLRDEVSRVAEEPQQPVEEPQPEPEQPQPLPQPEHSRAYLGAAAVLVLALVLPLVYTHMRAVRRLAETQLLLTTALAGKVAEGGAGLGDAGAGEFWAAVAAQWGRNLTRHEQAVFLATQALLLLAA